MELATGKSMEALIKTYIETLKSLNAQSFALMEDKYSGVFLPVPSEEYWHSPVKIMLVGRETAGWNTGIHKNKIARVLGLMPNITVEHVVEEAVTRYKEHQDKCTPNTKSRSRFMQYYFLLARKLELPPKAIVYANLFAWDYDRKSPLLRSENELQEIASVSLRLLATQIGHLKPDFVIFACGSRTDHFIKCLSNEYLGGSKTLSVTPKKIWKFEAGDATCFRIAHPRATYGHQEFRAEVIEQIKQAAVRLSCHRKQNCEFEGA